MSPSRRRAIGAVRALARAPLLRAPLPPRALPLGAVRPVFGALGVTRRRALRGYRGAHGDAPGKTLSVCYLQCQRHITHDHGARALPCGAMGTSRPTAITPAKFARALRPPFTTPVHTARAPWCGPVAVGRDGRPPRPWGLPTLPARAAAPLSVAARHRGARLSK